MNILVFKDVILLEIYVTSTVKIIKKHTEK